MDSDYETGQTGIAVEPEPTAPGYTFSGWSVNQPAGLAITESEGGEKTFAMPDSDVEFTGFFTPNPHKVIYEVDGAEYDSQNHDYGTIVTKGEGVTDPTATNAIFKGWKLQSPAGLPIDENGRFTMPDDDVIFAAEFEPTFQVSYSATKDGAAYTLPAAYAPERFAKGAKVPFKDAPAAIEGYTFEGWTLPTGLSTDETGQFTMPQSDVVITGEYRKNSHAVIYMVSDTEHARQTKPYGTEVIKGAGVTDPTKENAEFKGWKLQSPSGLSIDENGRFTMPDEEVIFVAEFLGKYTVRYKAYDVNGDEITLDGDDYQPKEYHNGDEVTVAPVLTDDEYTFNGWNVESPDNLTLPASGKFTMPESDVLLTGRFMDGTVPPPEVYTITYRSGLKEGDAGYTEDLGTPHQFSVTVGADGKANHTVFANDAPELKYVRAGYTFAGWKLTKANPDPNPAPGGKGTVIAPRAYAANGLLTGGDVIDVDSNIVLTAQWTKKTSPDPDKDLDKPLSPGTGESAMPMVFAFNFAILSMLAIGTVLRKRRAR